MDPETILAIAVPPASSLLGAWGGWALARRAAREDQEREEHREQRSRQVEVAASFQAELVDALAGMRRGSDKADVVADKAEATLAAVTQAGRRAGVLADEEVERRFRALTMGLSVLGEYASDRVETLPPDRYGNVPSPNVNGWSLGLAADDLLQALIALQRGERPVPAIFPTAEEVARLSWDDGSGEEGDLGLIQVNRTVRKRLDALRRGDG